MNVWIRVLAIAGALVLLLSACTKKPTEEPTEQAMSPTSVPIGPSDQPSELPPTDTVSPTPEPPITPVPSPGEVKEWAVNSGVTLSVTVWSQSYSADGSLYLDAEANIPALSGVPAAVTEYYGRILESFQRRSEVVSAEVKAWQKAGSLMRSCELRQDFYTECNNGGFISVRRLETYDSGGLHPEMTLTCDNFRVSDGKLLSMDDFFNVPRETYYPVLLAKTIEILEKRADDLAEGWREDVEALFPFDAFCMTQGGLSLFFPEPSIASYAVGTVRVDIPWESIEGIWKLP